jgi:hypothetical protein
MFEDDVTSKSSCVRVTWWRVMNWEIRGRQWSWASLRQGVPKSRETKFYTVAVNVCGSWVWNLAHVTPLPPRIFSEYKNFGKIFALPRFKRFRRWTEENHVNSWRLREGSWTGTSAYEASAVDHDVRFYLLSNSHHLHREFSHRGETQFVAREAERDVFGQTRLWMWRSQSTDRSGVFCRRVSNRKDAEGGEK